ncbi:MAG: tetratricopeptide repeat protein [Pseudomonadota bacterium]
MLIDICRCKTSLTDQAALTEWNGVIHGVLSHGQSGPVHLGALLKAAPDYAMAHAARGLFSLMMGRRELVSVAHEANAAAQRTLALGGATERERLWCEALQDWLTGHPSTAVARMERALRLNPADTISMKVSQGIRFIHGDSIGMLRSVEAVMAAHDTDHPLRGYAYGCRAFALEETGNYTEAERSGLAALQAADDDAWGLHAVAHVYDMTNRPDQGIALIDQNNPAWSHCNNFRFHVWWHKALLILDQGDYAQVLDLYDTQIRSDKTDDYRDFSNASSLLLRLQLEGVDVGTRWNELADLAESRTTDGCLVFADLHYMLALAGDNRHDAAARLTARVARDAQAPGELAPIMGEPGVSAARGLAAFGEGRYDLAFAHLRAAQPKFQNMGGSHAQRDIFERVTIEAGLRAGHLDATERLITERNRLRADNVDAFAMSRLERIAAARAVQASVAAE